MPIEIVLFPHQIISLFQNAGSPSVYGEITSHGGREEKEFRATNGFEIESFDKVLYINNVFLANTSCMPKFMYTVQTNFVQTYFM